MRGIKTVPRRQRRELSPPLRCLTLPHHPEETRAYCTVLGLAGWGRRTENPRVGGSIPPLATTSISSIAYKPRDPVHQAPTIGLIVRRSTAPGWFFLKASDPPMTSAYPMTLESNVRMASAL